MKNLFLIAVLLSLCTQIGISQTYITTDTKLIEVYNKNTDKYETVSEQTGVYTTIIINKEMSSFKHTTDDLTSIYFIKSMYKIEGENDMFKMEVVSDVGNEYLMYTSFPLKKIFFSHYTKDGKHRMITLGIKAMHID